MDNITRNDAINRVRDYIENNTCSQKYLDAFKLLIPELNDSKDERIRKALVQEFKEKVQKSFEWKDGIPNNAVLDWLERQKESWTEEDENMFSDFLFFMERYKEKIDKGSHPYVDKVVNWFKSKFNK